MPAGFLLLSTLLLAPPPEDSWHTDLAKAKLEALKTDRPILAVLH